MISNIFFIDELSQFTWFLLMKEQFELLSILTIFANEFKTQFGKKKSKFLEVITQNNIFILVFLLFCHHMLFSLKLVVFIPLKKRPYLKRKNRHLVETAWTMLLHVIVLIQHRGDAVSMSYFLINQMHSSIIDHKIPYSILFLKEPLFHVAPQIFGCNCFVNDLSPSLNKLSSRAVKCVFQGYYRLQKIYKCHSFVYYC